MFITFITRKVGIHVTGMYVVVIIMLIEGATTALCRRLHRHCSPQITAEQLEPVMLSWYRRFPFRQRESPSTRYWARFSFLFAVSEIKLLWEVLFVTQLVAVFVNKKWPPMRTLPVVDVCNGFFFFIHIFLFLLTNVDHSTNAGPFVETDAAYIQLKVIG